MIILYFIFLTNIAFSCSPGCRMCDISDQTKCLICDSLNGYYLESNGNCVQTSIAHCAYFKNGTCQSCETGYIKKIINGVSECQQIDSTQCSIFYSKETEFENHCLTCKPNSIYNNQYPLICEVQDNINDVTHIANCDWEYRNSDSENNIVCYKCKENYILNSQGSCTDVSGIAKEDNCLVHSDIKCKSCPKQQYNNPLISSLMKSEDPSLTLLFYQFNNKQKIDVDTCFSSLTYQVPNCSEATKPFSCSQCNDGYYLQDEYKCMENPVGGGDPNCVRFLDFSLSICLKCKDKFFLDTPSTCKSVLQQLTDDSITEPTECQVYDQTIDSVKCLECSSDYYISDSDALICSERANLNQPTNCYKNHPSKIGCSECLPDTLPNPLPDPIPELYLNMLQPATKSSYLSAYPASTPTEQSTLDTILQDVNNELTAAYTVGITPVILTSDFTCSVKIESCLDQVTDNCKQCVSTFTGTSTSTFTPIPTPTTPPTTPPASIVTTSSCTFGPISNCDQYDLTDQKCLSCVKPFLLSNEICSGRNYVIDKCDNYHQIRQQECDLCEKGTLFINTLSTCEQTLNDKCLEFEDANTCTKCKDGYDLINSNDNSLTNECVNISGSNNCVNSIESICNKCADGYLLQSLLNQCVPLQIDDTDCSKRDTGILAQGCNQCKVPSFKFQSENSKLFVCFPEEKVILINNCLSYIDTGCSQCNLGYSLSINTVSNSGETLDYAICIQDSLCTGDIYLNNLSIQNKICQSNTNNCKVSTTSTNNITQIVTKDGTNPIIYTEIFTQTQQSCLSCKPGFVPTQKCSTVTDDYSFFSANTSLPSDKPNLKTFYPLTDCTQVEAAVNEYHPTDLTNCENYKVVTTDKDHYFCQKCKFGFTGPIVEHTLMNFVDCNAEIEHCKVNEYLANTTNPEALGNQKNLFGMTLPYLYSCHSCDPDTSGGGSEERIPFVHKSIDQGLVTYDIAQINPSGGQGNSLTVCRKPVFSEFQILETDWSFPENCGLGYVVTDFNKSTVVPYPTITCYACKSGYFAVYEKKFIKTCNLIPTCAVSTDQVPIPDHTGTGNTFNECTKCPDNFSFKIKDNLELNECMTNDIASDGVIKQLQYQYQPVASEPAQGVCSKGFFQINELDCQKLVDDSCLDVNSITSGNMFKNFLFDTTFENLRKHFISFYQPYKIGCNKCDTGKIIIGSDNNCFQSEELVNYLADNSTSTKFLQNCSSFDISLKCLSCSDGYIFNIDETICVPKVEFPNCIQTNIDGSACALCEDFYHLGLSCVAFPNNCIEATNTNPVICTKCNSSSKLVGNLCVNDDNCLEFNDSGVCIVCQSGFMRLERDANIICLPMPIHLINDYSYIDILYVVDDSATNPSITPPYQYYNMKDYKCQENRVKIPKTNPKQCFQLNQIENCKEYGFNQNHTFQNKSEFECTECEVNYYLTEQTCKSVTVIPNCEEYNKTVDECQKCENPKVVSLLKNSCEDIKLGDINCEKYEFKDNIIRCKLCKDNYGLDLSDYSCDLITGTDLVNKCLRYKKDSAGVISCISCDVDYQLDSTRQCETNGPANCISWDGVICKICKPGFDKIFVSPGIVCEEVISPCLKLDINNKCIFCENTHKLSDTKICEPRLADNILNCKYQNQLSCDQCEEGFILNDLQCVDSDIFKSIEMGVCNFETNINTSDELVLEDNCQACMIGFYLVSGNCKVCPQDNCSVCDHETCYVCNSGYYSVDKQCTQNQTAAGAQGNTQQSHLQLYLIKKMIIGMIVILVFAQFNYYYKWLKN